jgi:hypothetical protein
MKAWLLKPAVPRYAFLVIWLALVEQLYVNHRPSSPSTWPWAGLIAIGFTLLVGAVLAIRRATVNK